MKITTIKLNKTTKDRLDKLKIHRRESYDEVLQEVLKILNICKREPIKAKSRLIKIDRARADFERKDRDEKGGKRNRK